MKEGIESSALEIKVNERNALVERVAQSEGKAAAKGRHANAAAQAGNRINRAVFKWAAFLREPYQDAFEVGGVQRVK